MEQGDIIRITDVQAMDGYSDPIRNIYYYHVFTMNTPADLQIYAADIAQAFGTTVLTPVAAIQSIAVKHIELEFLNMSFQQEESTETWDVPIPGVHDYEPAPAQVAYSFKLQRYARVVRNGAKRISGVPEDANLSGRILAPSYVTAVNAAATAFATTLNVTSTLGNSQLVPIIVRVPANPGVTPTVYTTITEGSFRGFGSQNTRKQL